MSLNIPIFIFADVNCNMLWPKEKEAKALHDFCDSLNLTQVINKITQFSKSIINIISLAWVSGVFHPRGSPLYRL